MEFKLISVDCEKNTLTLANKFYTEVIDFNKNDLVSVINKHTQTKWWNEKIYRSFMDEYNAGVAVLMNDFEMEVGRRTFMNFIRLALINLRARNNLAR